MTLDPWQAAIEMEPLVRKLARNIVNRGVLEVDDLVQVGLIAAMRAVQTFQADRSRRPDALRRRVRFLAWRAMRDHARLHGQSVNQAERAFYRRTARQRAGEPDVHPTLEQVDESEHSRGITPEMAAMRVEDRRRVRAAIHRLPRREREVMLWLLRNQRPASGLAAELRIPVKEARLLVREGHARLREMLEVECADH